MAEKIRTKKERIERRKENRDKRPCAHARHIRISPYKVRVVLDTVRGKSVNEALALLDATPKGASEVVSKLIRSATANAEHNAGLSRADLLIAEIFADGGPTLKRMQPVSKGRGYRINKRTSHITVILDAAKEAE
ncbi:MAG: 50S ribosomal protein L22 [Clostridiales bacterium]|jgi:large subunit ribosomal protein L22|nr:50S ribosomal protein L22 [Clostridiales bacterium]